MNKYRILTTVLVLSVSSSFAATTINDTNKYSYGANVGWVNWQADTTHGAVVGEYVCSNYVYAQNVGWIHLGDGTPTNGVRYTNLSADDYGVNHTGGGGLRGMAYGANIGWLRFESQGAPGINLLTGVFTGYVYSANAGWITLSNTQAWTESDELRGDPDIDGDGLPDPWELLQTNSIIPLQESADTDGDGATDGEEYRANTDPTDPEDILNIASFVETASTNLVLSWPSSSRRVYDIEVNSDLTDSGGWADHQIGRQMPDASGTTTAQFPAPETQQFYRVKAVKPLDP